MYYEKCYTKKLKLTMLKYIRTQRTVLLYSNCCFQVSCHHGNAWQITPPIINSLTLSRNQTTSGTSRTRRLDSRSSFHQQSRCQRYMELSRSNTRVKRRADRETRCGGDALHFSRDIRLAFRSWETVNVFWLKDPDINIEALHYKITYNSTVLEPSGKIL